MGHRCDTQCLARGARTKMNFIYAHDNIFLLPADVVRLIAICMQKKL